MLSSKWPPEILSRGPGNQIKNLNEWKILFFFGITGIDIKRTCILSNWPDLYKSKRAE